MGQGKKLIDVLAMIGDGIKVYTCIMGWNDIYELQILL